ncbi:MAG: hypothetical protein NWR72_10350 [Bacteroidia bacterium]|nr:hypothetical protein [Bacteroidia bacterium]
MKRIHLALAMMLGLPLFIQPLFAQSGVSFFSTEPTAFIGEFTGALNGDRNEGGKVAALALEPLWVSGEIGEDMKAQFITVANVMVSKRYRTVSDLSNLALIFARIYSGELYVKIEASTFLETTMEVAVSMVPERGSKYLRNLSAFLPEGKMVARDKFYWYASQNTPRLMMLEIKDSNGEYSAPVLRFSQTDVQYKSTKDSTTIHDTKGDFNLVSLNFIGTSGRVDWSKMGLPADEVYCDFGDYKLNLNYSLIKVDTAFFIYKNLINEVLVGNFEDRNIGYQSLNKANYPYFTSHEGGVVIDNFIPNVRYEGGFSLRGVRRIGTAYDVMEDYIPTIPEGASADDDFYSSYSSEELYSEESSSDEWNDSEWDYSSASGSSFSSDDETWGTDSWEYEDPAIAGEEGSYTYEEETVFPSQIRRHIPAEMDILRKGKTVMKLRGEAFVLDLDKMVSKNIEAVLYTSDEDSIFHPAMDALYTVADTTVILKKPKRGNFKSIPFSSSYHQYFLYFETIIWDMRTDELAFTAFVDRENKVMAIESYEFFNKARFDQFKALLPFNPIGAIYRYALTHEGQPIYPSSITEEYRLPEKNNAFEQILPSLEGSGFITYDKQSKEITPTDKLFHWSASARGKKDYDAIQLISRVDTGDHASMNLETMNIDIRGVQSFSLSDSQLVQVVPMNQTVTVLKDQGLNFAGAMAAGKLNLYGMDTTRRTFTFDYESYKIYCDSIDSVRFVLVRNPPPGYQPTPLERALSNTVFEGVTGALYIDHPSNKSGIKDRAEYPIFDSYGRSYLYWNKSDVEKGVYTKDKMHFSLDPFVLDSLEDFAGSNLSFEGEFFSSEIFPAFRQKLAVMEDFSLGFVQEAPPEGYRIYDGNGKFFNTVTLDGKGLRGNGSVEYLGTVAKSDSFVFHFDSVMAQVSYFNLKRGYRGGVYFPKVEANSALYRWYTKDSLLAIESQYEAIGVFEGEGQFTGRLSISKEGMVGNGEIVMGQIKVVSDSMYFGDMEFSAPHSDFVVVDKDDPELIHFIAKDVDITYDVFRHKSSFETKQIGKDLASFPLHRYSTSLVTGVYQRSTNDLKLSGASAYLKDNYFVSIDPAQDSLKFKAKEAYYNLESSEVVVSGVPNIYVADALITPAEEKVILLPEGKMQTLENALVEADQTSKFHRIYDARIDIFSRNEYEGGGKYDYIEINGKKQFIEFDNIRVNSDRTTTASGPIPDEADFYLTDRINFRGIAELDASEKFLAFGGEVKIESENPVFQGAWFTFEKTIVNPDSVFIPIKEDLRNEANEQLTVGLMFVPENRVFYSNFLQAVEDEDDINVLKAAGGLTFDRRKKEFKIGSEEKLKGQAFKGSTVSFNDAENTITSQGFLRFPYDFPERTISMKMAGQWKEDLRRRQLTTNIIMGVNFDVIPKEPLDALSDNFQFLTTASENIDFQQRTFLESVSELLDEGKSGERGTAAFLENLRNSMVYNDIKLSEQLPYTVLLSGVNFNFSPEYKALYSDSEVGLIGISGRPINKLVNAKIVYKFGSIAASGEKDPDILTIYLEIDEFNWVYFHFEDKVVSTISSDYTKYNYPLQAAAEKQKETEGYRFEVATEDAVSRFRQDFVMKFIR